MSTKRISEQVLNNVIVPIIELTEGLRFTLYKCLRCGRTVFAPHGFRKRIHCFNPDHTDPAELADMEEKGQTTRMYAVEHVTIRLERKIIIQ